VLSEAPTLASARAGIVEALGGTLGYEVGVIWQLDDGGDVLQSSAVWAADDIDAGDFLQATMTRSFARGEGLPGGVWLSGEPAFERGGSAAPAPLRAAIGETLAGRPPDGRVMLPVPRCRGRRARSPARCRQLRLPNRASDLRGRACGTG
jgi:hypothetical protein